MAIGMGFYECMHYSIVSIASALSDRRFKESDLVKLKNPLNQEQPCMRCALLGEMLQTVGRNFSRGNRDLFLLHVQYAFLVFFMDLSNITYSVTSSCNHYNISFFYFGSVIIICN